MVKYYLWAIAEKALSFIPGGENFYNKVGTIVHKNTRGTGSNFTSSFRITRKARELTPPGGTILDIGTGWYHHDAFLLYLVGDYKIYLFDVVNKSSLQYIKNYINHLLKNIDLISTELDISPELIKTKLTPLLDCTSKEQVYEICNFIPSYTTNTDKPFLQESSIDFMLSCCVLSHIPLNILVPELKSLHKMLKPDGYMYHLIGHDDHWSFHDKKANQFNFYRYSDKQYKRLFESFEYHNRFVKQEFIKIFNDCDLKIIENYENITEDSKKQILSLPNIDERFAKYPLEDLAIIHNYVLLQKK